MRIRHNTTSGFIGILLILLGLGPSVQAAWMVVGHSHMSVAELGDGWIGALDAGISTGYLPVEEIAVGLDATLILPLNIATVERQSKLAFDLYPMIWLRFGQASSWFYVKMGTGVTWHVTNDGLTPIWAVAGGAGVVVHTRDLPFFWGVEVSSRIGLSSAISTRSVGLGGIVGLRL